MTIGPTILVEAAIFLVAGFLLWLTSSLSLESENNHDHKKDKWYRAGARFGLLFLFMAFALFVAWPLVIARYN